MPAVSKALLNLSCEPSITVDVMLLKGSCRLCYFYLDTISLKIGYQVAILQALAFVKSGEQIPRS